MWVIKGLELHNEGKHGEAIKIYEKEVERGNVIGNAYLGNCYIFGVGVKVDVATGLSWWVNGGTIRDDYVDLFRMLSNIKYMNGTEINLSGLFILLLFK